MKESILNIDCSLFANGEAVIPKTINLLDALTIPDHERLRKQDAIRAAPDKATKDRLKKGMPAITPSGTFSKRGQNYLLKHTSLLAIDIDLKGNESIGNYKDLKKELCKIREVAYCGLSVSGAGFWLLIPIEHPDKYKQHFCFLDRYFNSKGIKIDKAPTNVASLRFISYDREAYFNHSAKPLQAIYEPKNKIGTNDRKAMFKVKKEAEMPAIFKDAIDYVIWKGFEFLDGQKHEFIFHLCSFLVSRNVPKYIAEDWINTNLIPLVEIKSNCISYPYSNYYLAEVGEIIRNEIPKIPKAIIPQELKQTLPKPICIEDSAPLKRFAEMALKSIGNRIMPEQREKYLSAWANDMRHILSHSGITQSQLITTIKNNNYGIR